MPRCRTAAHQQRATLPSLSMSNFTLIFMALNSLRCSHWDRWLGHQNIPSRLSLWLHFPVINSTDGLKEIDHYLQQNIRFLSTGKHNKANYRTDYAQLKQLGYKSLVNEFYKYKNKTVIMETGA